MSSLTLPEFPVSKEGFFHRSRVEGAELPATMESSVLSSVVATSHVRLSSLWNVSSASEELMVIVFRVP